MARMNSREVVRMDSTRECDEARKWQWKLVAGEAGIGMSMFIYVPAVVVELDGQNRRLNCFRVGRLHKYGCNFNNSHYWLIPTSILQKLTRFRVD